MRHHVSEADSCVLLGRGCATSDSSVEVAANLDRQQRGRDRPVRTIVQSAKTCEVVRASQTSSANEGQTLIAPASADLNERRTTAGNTERDLSHQLTRSALPLTVRQRDVLRFLEQWIEARGWPPSVDELGREVGLAKSTVDEHLNALERKGYVRRDAGEHRGLHVLVSSAEAKVVEPRPLKKVHYCARCKREVVGGER